MDLSKIAYAIWPWGTETPEQMEQAAKDITKVGFTNFESVKTAIYAFDLNLKAYKEVLDRYNLKPVSFYFHMGEKKDEANLFANLDKELEFVAALDVKRICLQATGFRPDMENKDAMPQDALDYELNTILKFAEKAKEFGITPCLHPHHNTWVMFEPEIDYMLQNSDPNLLMFAPDTAHLIAGNAEPTKVIRKYADRIGFIHLKDFTHGADIGSMGFSQSNVEVYSNFSELGTGDVDFPEVFRILDSVNFDGYCCVELDTAPSSNAESALKNLKYLESIL